MNTKICTKCGEEKAATSEFFFKQKRGKYGLRGQCKSCFSKYNNQYRENNKEKISKIQKRYYKNNRKKIIETHKQYYEANKEEILKHNKQYYQDNKDKVSEINKQYKQKNKHLYREWKAKRRAAKLNQTPDYANLDLIKLIYKNCPDGYQVDHIKPISSGGLHHESNLCYLPEGINQSKGAKTIEEFGEEEFNRNVIYWQEYLSSYQSPSLYPIYRHCQG